MNDLQEIEVTIAPSGELKVEIRGVKGPTCLDFTRGMEELLGGEVIGRHLTPEYDEQPQEAPGFVWAGRD